jgi:VanZ family protein
MNGYSLFLEKIHFDKIVHVSMFGIMMVLFGNPFNKTEFSYKQKLQFFIRIALLISFWGLITECIQLYVPKRSFDLLDWAADSLGVFLAFIFLTKFMTKREKL